MSTCLITGTSRGIGLELVKTFSSKGYRVFACCRNPDSADALNAFAKDSDAVQVRKLDVTDNNAIQALAKELSGEKIDVLINNAGVYGSKGASFGSIDYDAWVGTLKTNTIAPYFVTEAFSKHIASSEKKAIGIITSQMGSIADNQSGGAYAYRSSKSGVNAVTKSLSHDLASKGISVICIHPGWVQTDMGGPNALIETPESADGIFALLDGLTKEDSGKFFRYSGSELPW